VGTLTGLDFVRVALHAPRERGAALHEFYTQRLGVERLGDEGYAVGQAELAFLPVDEDAFYHFALLVPGDRFEAALEWASTRADVLPGDDGEVVFDFESWDALACYFLDPAGNIVELIAHRGLGDAAATGPFEARELLGFSEVGLVGDPRELAATLEGLDLRLWDGTLDEPDRLAFVGERARTLILSPLGRGWLPTGRPAEPHPVDVELTGPPHGDLAVGPHRIRRG
jgi:catechol 2,3-dioxygenase-like lactoylglutathione lyase family enzyme